MTNPPVPDDYYSQSDIDYYEQLEYYPSKSKQERVTPSNCTCGNPNPYLPKGACAPMMPIGWCITCYFGVEPLKPNLDKSELAELVRNVNLTKQESMNMTNRKYEVIATVDEYGAIRPHFKLSESPYDSTSGELKYFHKLEGKKVKITLEIIEEEKQDDQ